MFNLFGAYFPMTLDHSNLYLQRDMGLWMKAVIEVQNTRITVYHEMTLNKKEIGQCHNLSRNNRYIKLSP